MQRDAVIDMGLVGPAYPAEPDAPSARPRRGGGWATLLVSLLVAFSLLGPPEPPTGLSLSWSSETAHGMLWVDERSVYTVRRGPDALLLTASELGTGRVRWQRPLPGPLARLYLTDDLDLRPQFGPSTPARASIAATSTSTGQLHGTYPVPAMPLVHFSESVAVVIDRVPGTGPTRLGSGGPNQIGQVDDEPAFDGWREAHLVTALDLATGQTRWERLLPPGSTWALPGVHPWLDGFVGEPGAPAWMAVIGPDDVAQVWHLATGQNLGSRQLGPFGHWSSAIALPQRLLVNGGGWPSATLSAYEPSGLTRTWRGRAPAAPDPLSWPVPCGALTCFTSPTRIWAVEVTTGRLVWQLSVADLYAVGERMLAAALIDGPVLVDIATGDTHLLPEGWRLTDRRTRDGPLVAALVGQSRITLGLINAPGEGGAAGRPITVPRRIGDVGSIGLPQLCQVASTHLVCARDEVVRVWRMWRPGT